MKTSIRAVHIPTGTYLQNPGNFSLDFNSLEEARHMVTVAIQIHNTFSINEEPAGKWTEEEFDVFGYAPSNWIRADANIPANIPTNSL